MAEKGQSVAFFHFLVTSLELSWMGARDHKKSLLWSSNKLQNFYLKERINVKKIRIAFNSSTDFYGRITIYKLDVYAWDVAKTKVERARDIYLFCTNEVLCKVGCDTKVHILYQIYCTQVTYQNHSRVEKQLKTLQSLTMPKSKRDKKISLTRTEKKPGLETKAALVEKVRGAVDNYARIFVFQVKTTSCHVSFSHSTCSHYASHFRSWKTGRNTYRLL